MVEYKYDVAFSLLHADVEFAREIVSNLNPGISRFFYETNQMELITQLGPVAFSEVFKDYSRIVVIFSRPEWGKTFYTELEQSAILDRTKNGHSFLIVIPMERNATPSWYPSTRIYIDPSKFTAERIARFIEFKITDEGGIVKPITLEDRYEQLKQRIEAKKKLTQLQEKKEAFDAAKAEVAIVKDVFNQKISVLQHNSFAGIGYKQFTVFHTQAEFKLGEFLLTSSIQDPSPEFVMQKIVTTQDFLLEIKLFKLFRDGSKKILREEIYCFLYSETQRGWSIPFLDGQASNNDLMILFRNRTNSQYYDLKCNS
jgi:hypothetical protein